MITASLLEKITGGRANNKFVGALATAMNDVLPTYGINTALRQAHFLAQAAHESDGFKTMVEYASGEAYESRTDLGNTKAKDGDGPRYKGRGIFQLTGAANYRAMGKKLGLDLVKHPELAAVPLNAVMIACEYWNSRKLNALADKDDVRGITYKINGGYNGLSDRIRYLGICKRVLGASQAVGLLDPIRPTTRPEEATGGPVLPVLEADPVLTPDSPAPFIMALQAELKAKNYDPGAIDGKWTPDGLTQSAVVTLQGNNKLPINPRAIRLSEAKAAPVWILPNREKAGVTETRQADSPAGNTVRFWDRMQKWLLSTAAAIGIPIGGSAIEQAEGGASFFGRVKGVFEPFGGLGWLFTGYTPWLIIIAGLVGFIVIGQNRKKTAAEDHRNAATS